jgi:peptidoglycan/xylan/chitin deacetylase (PgdA/CDA1 family)
MADTYWQSVTGFGVVDDPVNVPGGAAIITEAAYDALLLAANNQNAAAEALWTQPDFLSPLRPAQGAVCFTWDDGWDSHPMLARMHADRGQRATFYITTNLLGTAQHIASTDVAPMVALGHEIGCHNADHVSMTSLTPATRAAQWAAQQTLETLIGDGYQVRSYAYPFGTHDLTTDQEGYGRFDRLATVGLAQGYIGGSPGASTLPWLYGLDFEGFRHGRFPWSQTTHGQFMQLLQYAARRRIIISPYAHQAGNPDTPTLAQITEAMDFCATNGIPCLTTREAFPGPKVVNPGFEDGLNGWVTILAGAAAGDATVDVVTDAPGAGLPGTKSLRIISPSTTTSSDSVKVFQTLPVEPNRAYSLSARIRNDVGAAQFGSGRLSVRINEYNAVGVTVTGRSVRAAGGLSTVWAQSAVAPTATDIAATLVGKTHPDTRYMEVGIYLQEATGTFYADHVYFGPTEEGLLG